MTQLRIPGPTPLPDEVLQSMTKQMINHRGKEFEQILNGVTDKLKQFFQTKGDVFLLTGSGTGGLEAAIVNTLSPGDKVLSVSIGVFGERFATIAEQFGAEVIPLRFEWGTAADIDAIRQALHAELKIKAVLVTHNETSTGVTNDLASISSVVKEFDKLLLVVCWYKMDDYICSGQKSASPIPCCGGGCAAAEFNIHRSVYYLRIQSEASG